MNDASVNIGKPVVSAHMTKSECLMVYAEGVKERCVKVVHVNFVHYCMVSVFIGLAIGRSLFETSSANQMVNPAGL